MPIPHPPKPIQLTPLDGAKPLPGNDNTKNIYNHGIKFNAVLFFGWLGEEVKIVIF